MQVIAEPGRYFASACMSVCASVISAGHSKLDAFSGHMDGQPVFEYYLNDGLYGSFNCIMFDHQHPHGQPLFVSFLCKTQLVTFLNLDARRRQSVSVNCVGGHM